MLGELVGREEELEVIRSFLQTAAVDGGTLLLTGEQGIGKTALLGAAVGELWLPEPRSFAPLAVSRRQASDSLDSTKS